MTHLTTQLEVDDFHSSLVLGMEGSHPLPIKKIIIAKVILHTHKHDCLVITSWNATIRVGHTGKLAQGGADNIRGEIGGGVVYCTGRGVYKCLNFI